MNNQDKINLVLEDLETMHVSGCDQLGCSLNYALNNGFDLHAANLWTSTGAMSEHLEELFNETGWPAIDREKELKEINQMCDDAFIYECPDCNAVGFYDYSEGDSVVCESCLKTAFKAA